MLAPDPAVIEAAQRIREKATIRAHRLGHPDELKEESMPRSIYERKKVAEKPAATEPKSDAPSKKKPGRKPKAKPEVKATKAGKAAPRKTGPQAIFAVDSTGAIAIRRGDFGMELSPGEAQQFVGFLRKIGIPA